MWIWKKSSLKFCIDIVICITTGTKVANAFDGEDIDFASVLSILSLFIVLSLGEGGRLSKIEGHGKLIQFGDEMEPVGRDIPNVQGLGLVFQNANGCSVVSDREFGPALRCVHGNLNCTGVLNGCT